MVHRLWVGAVLSVVAAVAQTAGWQSLDIAPVWAGHPVGFDLLTDKGRQYVAFYDADRKMTVATRAVGSREWKMVRLPSQLVWDSHNYVTMAIDREGFLHVSGNMHVVPLVYFRSTKPGDIESLERVPSMVGANETRCTYPRFLRGPKQELLFTYRDGSSGNGNQIYNVYDEKTRAWKRLLDKPLTDGEGKSNAYFADPVLGPDGYFHLVWVWRNTPDCSTNHDLTYARSRDMAHWETSAGKPLELPIRVSTAEIVDPVPVKGGMINGNARIGFDSKKRPVITYHKYDEKGFTQIYNARLEDGKWRIYKTSDWDYRWEFSGGGSIHFEVRVAPVRVADGGLLLDYSHDKLGSGTWRLDEATLRPVGSAAPRARGFSPGKPSAEGMQVNTVMGKGSGGGEYVLRWETLGPNRDRPRTGDLPGPSMLRLWYRGE